MNSCEELNKLNRLAKRKGFPSVVCSYLAVCSGAPCYLREDFGQDEVLEDVVVVPSGQERFYGKLEKTVAMRQAGH